MLFGKNESSGFSGQVLCSVTAKGCKPFTFERFTVDLSAMTNYVVDGRVQPLQGQSALQILAHVLYRSLSVSLEPVGG